MAKKSAIEKNNRRARMVQKYAGRRERLKAIANDEKRPQEERFLARLKLAELPRNSSPTRVRNRCQVTGRPRGNCSPRAISRMKRLTMRSSSE